MSTLKAYALSDATGYTESACIVFATSCSKAKALLRCCDGLHDVDFVDVRAKRAHKFDDASHPPTAEEYIARGWTLSCSNCERACNDDMDDEDDEGNPVEYELVYRGQRVFCSQDCLDRFVKEFPKAIGAIT